MLTPGLAYHERAGKLCVGERNMGFASHCGIPLPEMHAGTARCISVKIVPGNGHCDSEERAGELGHQLGVMVLLAGPEQRTAPRAPPYRARRPQPRISEPKRVGIGLHLMQRKMMRSTLDSLQARSGWRRRRELRPEGGASIGNGPD
jgi:hypothetical protein